VTQGQPVMFYPFTCQAWSREESGVNIKGILSIFDQNLDHGDFVYICMKLKEGKILSSHAVMFDK